MAQVKISELAQRSGFSPSTLRYYEKVGLLDRPERNAAGYRTYDEEVLDRLSFVAGAKRMRFTLEDIAQLLGLWANGACAPVQHRMLALLAERRAAVEGEISELRTFAGVLGTTYERLDAAGPSDACGADCGCDLTASSRSPAEASIACTLGADDVPQRVSQWHAVAAAAVARSATEAGVRLTLPPSADLASRVASLAAAETRCCSFFRMTLTMASDALTLDIECPTAARPLLEELLPGQQADRSSSDGEHAQGLLRREAGDP